MSGVPQQPEAGQVVRALVLRCLAVGLKAKSNQLTMRDRLAFATQALSVTWDEPVLRSVILGFLDGCERAPAEAGAVMLKSLDQIMDDLGIVHTEAALRDADALPEGYVPHRAAPPSFQSRRSAQKGADGLFDWQRQRGAGFDAGRDE